jgi:phosphonate degradation associated HDIG domain protein
MKISTIEDITNLYKKWGSINYSEAITQTEHAVQCARLAEEEDSPSHLVIAALLHDIGHLVDLEQHEGKEIFDVDTAHEATGSRCLVDVLPSSVRLPIALHVDAKRWLCARQPGYFETLSPASTHSLQLQGGPMNDEEVTRFEAMPGFSDAVALRLWDDRGKNKEWGGTLDDFVQILESHAGELTSK